MPPLVKELLIMRDYLKGMPKSKRRGLLVSWMLAESKDKFEQANAAVDRIPAAELKGDVSTAEFLRQRAKALYEDALKMQAILYDLGL